MPTGVTDRSTLNGLARAEDPRALDEYVHVAGPTAWMILAAIASIAIAGLIWGLFGSITVTCPGLVEVDETGSYVFLPGARGTTVRAGDVVEAGGAKGVVTETVGDPIPMGESLATYLSDMGLTELEGDWICQADVSIDVPDGLYRATVTVGTYTPLELLFGDEELTQGTAAVQ